MPFAVKAHVHTYYNPLRRARRAHQAETADDKSPNFSACFWMVACITAGGRKLNLRRLSRARASWRGPVAVSGLLDYDHFGGARPLQKAAAIIGGFHRVFRPGGPESSAYREEHCGLTHRTACWPVRTEWNVRPDWIVYL